MGVGKGKRQHKSRNAFICCLFFYLAAKPHPQKLRFKTIFYKFYHPFLNAFSAARYNNYETVLRIQKGRLRHADCLPA
ncbi:MAG: hypothetical protein HP049_01640 [Clostridiales bacterium]|jgi:hypothetical protein|nr:hypothetical protein [Clostridiales bacterium]